MVKDDLLRLVWWRLHPFFVDRVGVKSAFVFIWCQVLGKDGGSVDL